MNTISQRDIGKKRIYNSAFAERGRDDVIKWDIFPVKNTELIKVVFESSSSPWRQGIWLRTDKGIFVNAVSCKSLELWFDTAPPEVVCQCFTSDGMLSVYNIWDRGNGRASQSWSSGMLVEELDNGRLYRCNDIGFDTNFDKIVFRIERTMRGGIP
jgi:hypothetical protein